MPNWVEIDSGGGGQAFRIGLSLALITGRPARLLRLRAGKAHPGLSAPDLAILRAVQMIAPTTRVNDARVGSDQVSVLPGPVRPGRYALDAGAGGAIALLLQTVALPLVLAGGRSQLTVAGATHAPRAPSFEFLDEVWARWLALLGANIRLELHHAGFAPRGGGSIGAEIEPMDGPLGPLDCCSVVQPNRLRIVSMQTSNLAAGVERRTAAAFAAAVRRRPKLLGALTEVERTEGRFDFHGSTGLHAFACLERGCGPAGFQHVSGRGDDPEQAGRGLAKTLLAFLESEAAVDPYSADQLLLPLAMARAPSRFTTPALTAQMRSQIAVLHAFLGSTVELDEGTPLTVRVSPPPRA